MEQTSVVLPLLLAVLVTSGFEATTATRPGTDAAATIARSVHAVLRQGEVGKTTLSPLRPL